MEELYSLFASALAEKIPSLNRNEGSVKTRGFFGEMQPQQKTQTKLQLNRIPVVIDLDYYRNAHSSDNPVGDYCAAYRFYKLADEASDLTVFFEGVHSVSSIWGGIINSAKPDNGYADNLLVQAKDSFRLSRMYGMGGVPEDWYQVNAQPSNWYDLVVDKKNLTRIEIEPHKVSSSFNWNIGAKEQIKLDKRTTVNKICIDVLSVEFIRPWLRRELFAADWNIPDIKKGYFSTGDVNNNAGVLPLITQSMLVGTNLSIEGDFSDKDKEIISNQQIGELSIGPFALKSCKAPMEIEKEQDQLRISSETTQVVGYLSYCVPLCPKK